MLKKWLVAAIPFSYLLLMLFEKDLAMLGDLGRHLKLGELVINCFCVPQTNLFSYTNPNFPIVNHEWLAEVVFYLTSTWFGLHGLFVLKMILVITSGSLVYLVALKKGSLFWVTVFSLLSITIFSMRFFVLPELFSYLFIGLFLFLLQSFKETKKLWLLWLLPVFEVLWVNMHIYFILGIAIYGFFVLETFLKEKKLEKIYLVVGVLLILGTLLNPSGIRGALLPFTFSSNYGFVVEENQSPLTIFTPNSTNSNLAYTLLLQVFVFEMLIAIFALCFFVKKQWKETSSMGQGLMAALLGLKFTRCISLFGLLGLAPLVQTATALEEKLKKNMEEPMRNILKGTIFLGVMIIVLIHIKGLMDYKLLDQSFEPAAEKAVAFMKQARVQGKIFNNYVVGNYLIYGLYPKEQVYIDARPEAYPAAFFNDYWRMMADEAFFNEQVQKYNINAVVFNVFLEDPNKIRPFLTRLLQSPDWVPVYGDGRVTIFVRNTKINADVIKQYKISVNGQ